MAEEVASDPTATGLLIQRTLATHQEIANRYEDYISTVNDDRKESNLQPVLPWTEDGYNYDMVYMYISFRTLFGVGKVEDSLQLGTLVRETNSLNNAISTSNVNDNIYEDRRN